MDEMKDAGISCDIDYVVYETLDCGVTTHNIKEKTEEDLNITIQRLEALTLESRDFIGKIKKHLYPQRIFECPCGFKTGSMFEYEEHNEICGECEGLHYG